MKILFLHSSAILGGSERAFLDLFKGLSKIEQSNSLILFPDSGPLLQKIEEENPLTQKMVVPFPLFFKKTSQRYPLLSIALLIFSTPFILIYISKISKILRRTNFDIIYSNGIKCHFLSLFAGTLTKKKIIWHMQDYFPNLWYSKLFLSLFTNGPHIIISNSLSVETSLKENLPAHWKCKFVLAHNAVDPDVYKCQNQIKTNGATIISLVGMLAPWKGQHIFLQAAHQLSQKYTHLQFQIVGDEVYKTYGNTGYRQQLETLVNSLKLSSSTRFLGFIDDLREIYEQSDIIVHASIRPEPFGRVIIEAMAFERPIVATNGGGVKEIIIDGKTGLLAKMNDFESLSEAIETLILNPKLRQNMGTQGRRRVIEKFSARAFTKTITQALNEI